MMWVHPKTDWKAGDFFNISDYNRIKGNLDELKGMSQDLKSSLDYSTYEDMGPDKTYQDISFYADEINRFEDNLETVCKKTYALPIGDKQVFEANVPFIGSAELNRIESAILRLYDNLKNQHEGRRMCTFMLGTREAF